MARVRLDFPEKSLYNYETTLRLNDLSQAMHLGFDRLVNVLHDAAADFLLSLGHDMTKRHEVELIFADLAVQYLSEAFRGDRLKIEVGVGDVASKGFEAMFRVINLTRSEGVVAIAKIGIVFFDYEKGSTAEIPQHLKEKLS